MSAVCSLILAVSFVFTIDAGASDGASLLFQKGDWKRAAAAYEEMVKESPTFENYTRMADAYFYRGKRNRSGKIWQKAHELFDNAETRISIALFRALREKDAGPLLEMREEYPSNARLLRNIAFLYMYGMKNDNKSIEYFHKAAEADPADYISYFYAGTVYEDNFKYDKAIVEYKRSAAINPRFAQTLNNHGYCYKEKHFYTYAIEMYKKAIAELSDVDSYHYNIGNAYLHKKMVDEAHDAYARALELNPDFAKAHYNIARTLLRKGNHEAAIKEFEIYMKLWTPALPARDVPHPERVKEEIIEIEHFLIAEQKKKEEEERIRKILLRRKM